MRLSLTVLLCLSLAGCVTDKATYHRLPPERASECVAHCDVLGMKLSAVVIIKNAAGCVCQPKDAPQADATQAAVQGAAVAAGGAVISDEEEQQQQARNAQMGAGKR
jgi:hypothetical protein